MNKKENGTIGFFDLPPATCPKATPRPPATSYFERTSYVGCPFLVVYLHNKVSIQAQLLSPPIYSYI